MMSVQIFILATFTVVSGAIVGHAGSDASGTGTRQPNADETHTDVVSMDVAEDIRARQERRRAIREIKERQMEAVRAEADARAQHNMEAARNATLAADRARHKRHEEMRKDGELPVVPASTVVHLVRIPHPKNQTVHRHQNHNTFNQTGTPTSASTIASTPQLAKALASKNITHTSAAANASRLNATKTAEKHKEVIAAKANNMSQKAAQAASKGVTAAFHSARMAAEKLRKNHLAKRESIERKRSTESDGDSEEKIHAEKIKKAVIEVEGDDLANALKGVFSFPAKVKTTSTTTTTTTTTSTTTSTTTTTTAETTTALATVTTTTTAQAANETMDVVAKNFSNASMNVVALNVSNANANMDVVAKDVSAAVNSSVAMFSAELDKIEAEIKKDREDKKKAIDKDDLETALVLKKELEELTNKRNALEPHNTSSTPNRTTELAFFFGKAPDGTAQQPAINKSSAVALHSPLRAAKIAASKLRGTHE